MTSPMASLNTFAWGRWLKWPFMAVVALVGLSLVTAIYTAGHPNFAAGGLDPADFWR